MQTPTIQQQIDFVLEKKRNCEKMGFNNRAFMFDAIAQSLIALGYYQVAEENEKAKSLKPATQDDIDEDLNEIAHWFGGFDELKERVNLLHENDKEAAYERAYDPTRQ